MSFIQKGNARKPKPKAPVRRGVGAPPSAASSTPRQSVDRQSQTPAPVTQPTTQAPSILQAALSETNPEPPITQSVETTTRRSPTPTPIFAPTPAASSETSQVPPDVVYEHTSAPEEYSVNTIIPARQRSHESPLTPEPELTNTTSSVAENSPQPSRKRPAEVISRSQPLSHADARQDHVQTNDDQVLGEHHGEARNNVELGILSQAVQPTVQSSDTLLDNGEVAQDNEDSEYPALEDLVSTTRTALPAGRAVSEADLSRIGAGEARLASDIVPIAPLNPDGTSGEAVEPGPPTKKGRPAKRRRLDEGGLDVRPTIEVQLQRGRPEAAAPIPKKRRSRKPKKDPKEKKRKKRGGTPSDGEDQEIDKSTVKMSELCKDIRIGRKFSRHAEIKQRDTERKARLKLAKEHPELMAIEEHRTELGGGEKNHDEQAASAHGSGPQIRMVNGQIIIDDRSLVVDRHAMADAENEEMEVVEENEFTKFTTAGTLMKREKNITWTYTDEEKFYNGLRMFGTDFEMIAQMFSNRNRRQIKLKFNKEERNFPARIASVLIGGKIDIDLEEFKESAGVELEETAVINAEYEEAEKEHNEEQARLKAQADEATRQKKAAIQGRSARASSTQVQFSHGGEAGAGGADSAKENEPEGESEMTGNASAAPKSRKKGPTKKKRNLHSARGGGGEEVVVLGSLD